MSTDKNKNKKAPDAGRLHNEVYKAMVAVTRASRRASTDAGLGKDLLELVNVRVSQLNGCVACLSVHIPAAMKQGISEYKIGLLTAWQDAAIFSDKERAALELAEDITRLDEDSKRADVAIAALDVFTEEQVAALEWAIYTINTFNRISIYSDLPAVGKWNGK